jgi:hypothetical protein
MEDDAISQVEGENLPVLLASHVPSGPTKLSKTQSPYLQVKRKELPRVQRRREKLAKIWRLKELEKEGIAICMVGNVFLVLIMDGRFIHWKCMTKPHRCMACNQVYILCFPNYFLAL